MRKNFYSHGKLLLTGEYLVLDGAKVLGIPTKKGQTLTVKENNTKRIHWKSYDVEDNCWFEATFQYKEKRISIIKNSIGSAKISDTLIHILNSAIFLNPEFLTNTKGLLVETKLEFPRDWGLGSSSTLINNIAQWSTVNAFTLLEKSFGGSGYDIACAQHNTPILYQRNNGNPLVDKIEFIPSFAPNLYFVHLNKKQDSKDAIRHYRSLPIDSTKAAIEQIQEITQKIVTCQDLSSFKMLLSDHEQIISEIIKIPTIKSRLFSEYQGAIKSLGGWGGDFILATGSKDEIQYFQEKGYHTIIPYYEIVL